MASSNQNPNTTEFISKTIKRVFKPISKPNEAALKYPFSFITRQEQANESAIYDLDDFCKGVLGEEKCSPGNFPSNIVEYYWIHKGQNDKEPWMCLCKLDNDCYVFYSASCDYTGFDCQGGMEMVISKNPARLFYEGMTEEQRDECLEDKVFTKKYKKVKLFGSEYITLWKGDIGSKSSLLRK